MKAVWFRPDKFAPEFELSEMYAMLYRRARLAGYEIKSERSNITRGWTYNAPIYRMVFQGIDSDGIHRHRYVPHGAGQGANPMLAMIDALRICRVNDPLTLATTLEAEVWLLARAARLAAEREKRQAAIEAKLDTTLALLTNTLCSYRAPTAAPQPIPAKPDEDDDL